jgi:hypothetical protein
MTMGALLTNFHFLLAFGDEKSLLHMDDPGRMALSERVARSGPSENAWRALLELFASWPENDAKIKAYELVNRKIGNWDDRLRVLNSSWTILYDDGALTSLARIARTINISRREQYGNKELSAIVRSPAVSDIGTLVINRSEIFPGGFTALAASPYLGNLRTLALEGLTLSDEKFAILFGAANLGSLQYLRLKDLGLNTEIARRLVHSSLMEHVSELEISFNNLDEEAAGVLAASPKIRELRSLNVQNNFIRDKGALALAKAALTGNIKELNLAGNELSNNGRSELQQLAPAGVVTFIL